MKMRIKVKHTTTYRYDEPPSMVQLLRQPDNYEGQTVNDWLIDLNCDADLVRSRDAATSASDDRRSP